MAITVGRVTMYRNGGKWYDDIDPASGGYGYMGLGYYNNQRLRLPFTLDKTYKSITVQFAFPREDRDGGNISTGVRTRYVGIFPASYTGVVNSTSATAAGAIAAKEISTSGGGTVTFQTVLKAGSYYLWMWAEDAATRIYGESETSRYVSVSGEEQKGANLYDGSAWGEYEVYVYDGSNWQQYAPHYYDGSAWQEA